MYANPHAAPPHPDGAFGGKLPLLSLLTHAIAVLLTLIVIYRARAAIETARLLAPIALRATACLLALFAPRAQADLTSYFFYPFRLGMLAGSHDAFIFTSPRPRVKLMVTRLRRTSPPL